jgi:predicted DNA-binding transcriptional regulator YafY
MLQGRREWAGAELAERLEVDVRTVRRDVDRLRDLGYVIEASAGPGGGYRLGAGSVTPPLLLDDAEALAVAVALSAAASSVANLQDVALRVLVKLDQLLPARLRRRLGALQAVTVSLAAGQAGVDPTTLTALAAACRDHVRVRFAYLDRSKQGSARDVEPTRLVHTGRVWYLVAWDTQRADWRTFRVDRIDPTAGITPGSRFVPREPPEDLTTFVSRSISASPYRHQVRLGLAGSAREVATRIPPWVGLLEPDGKDRCTLTIGAGSYDAVTALILHAGVDFTLIEPAEAAAPIREIARRLLRGIAAPPAPRARRHPGRRGSTGGSRGRRAAGDASAAGPAGAAWRAGAAIRARSVRGEQPGARGATRDRS